MMSNVIAFLETLGSDPRLAGMDATAFAAAVDSLALDDAARAALLARDADALNGLLGGRLQMMCLLFPADGEPPKEDEPTDDEPADDEKRENIGFAARH
jgi:hypothetical protein